MSRANYWDERERRREQPPLARDADKDRLISELQQKLGDAEARVRISNEKGAYHANINADFYDQFRSVGRYIFHGKTPADFAFINAMLVFYKTPRALEGAIRGNKLVWPLGLFGNMVLAFWVLTVGFGVLYPPYVRGFTLFLFSPVFFLPGFVWIGALFIVSFSLAMRLDSRRKPS